ncbi:MAG: hypothetical protein ABJ246_20935 [Paracoccaceae bacterium]
MFGAFNLEIDMKKLVLAAAFAGFAGTAFAGAVSEAHVEAPVIVEEASSSSAGILLPLLLVAVLIAAAD